MYSMYSGIVDMLDKMATSAFSMTRNKQPKTIFNVLQGRREKLTFCLLEHLK